MKNFKNIISLFILIPIFAFSQGKKIDGIAAVVGDKIVLDSDIEQQKLYYKEQGVDISDQCKFVDNLLTEKMVLYYAEQDTLIKIDNENIKKRIDNYIERTSAQAGGIEKLLDYYRVRTQPELETDLAEIFKDKEYSEKKSEMITKGTDVSPQELKEFFEKYSADFPEIGDEVEISHITIKPEITDKHKKELIDQLNDFKKRIVAGETFDSMARLKSEDEGSAKNGGQYLGVKRGVMVKEFEAVAFNLDENQISDPFQTEYGYHIIKLEKRRGQVLDLRHILLKSTPTAEEIYTARKKLDSIKTLILENKITFKEAVFKFTNDKETRFNAGVILNPQTREERLNKLNLDSKTFFNVTGMKIGQISDSFEDEYQGKKVVRIIKLNNSIPAHKYSLDSDYDRIKKFAIQKKQQDILEKWVKEKIPSTFITVGKDYRNCNYTIDWLNEGDLKAKK